MTAIIPRSLWMGGTPDSWASVRARGIRAIVNVSELPTPTFAPFKGWTVDWPIDDGPLPDLAKLDRVSSLVVRNVERRIPSLVHCACGWNRSGLLVGVALVKLTGWDGGRVVDALRALRSKDVLCNRQFEDYIIRYKARPTVARP